MKKLTVPFLVTFSLLLGSAAFAQTSKALMTSKTMKKVVDENLVAVSFQLDNIADNAAKEIFDNKFKASQGVTAVTSTVGSAGIANYTVTLKKNGGMDTFTSMLIGAGVSKVTVDSETMDTTKLPEYLRKHQPKTVRAAF